MRRSVSQSLLDGGLADAAIPIVRQLAFDAIEIIVPACLGTMPHLKRD